MRNWMLCMAMAVATAVAAPAAAQFTSAPAPAPAPEEEASGEAPTGLGPFEVAPLPFAGNIGAPRSAVPETRLGLALHWVMEQTTIGTGTTAVTGDGNALGLLIEAHLSLFDVLEVGLDAEVLQYLSYTADLPAPFPDQSDSTTEFGFLVPRAKVAILSSDLFTMSAGLGIQLPTASGDIYDSVTPFGLDPGLYFQFTPFSFLSVNATVPLVVEMAFPDEGDSEADFFIEPAIGAAVMPLSYIGGFVDMQMVIWADKEEGAEAFQLMNLIIGARSQPLPVVLVEAGAIIPVAGDLADLVDFGLGIRGAATLDLF